MPNLPFSNLRALIAPSILIASIIFMAQAPLPGNATDQETELGQEIFNQLKNNGEIIESSPLYETLGPIAEAIARVGPRGICEANRGGLLRPRFVFTRPIVRPAEIIEPRSSPTATHFAGTGCADSPCGAGGGLDRFGSLSV
jgi:hypothetical protein